MGVGVLTSPAAIRLGGGRSSPLPSCNLHLQVYLLHLEGQQLIAAHERGGSNILSPLFLLYFSLLCYLEGQQLIAAHESGV